MFLKAACSNIRGAGYTGKIKVDNLTRPGFVGYVGIDRLMKITVTREAFTFDYWLR